MIPEDQISFYGIHQHTAVTDRVRQGFNILSCHDTIMNKTKLVLELPDALVSKLDEEVKENGCDSREEAVLFILRYYFDKIGRSPTQTF